MTHFGRGGGDRNGLNRPGIIRKPCSEGNRLRENCDFPHLLDLGRIE
jgi:hypothetical protein